MVGADTTGGVVIAGAACGGGTDPDCIAVIAPSDSECAPAAAGCPVTIPVANDWPTDVGDTPCPRAAGDSDPPGIAGAAGMPPPMTGGPAAGGDVTTGAGGTGPVLPRNPVSLTGAAGGRAATTPPSDDHTPPSPRIPVSPTDCPGSGVISAPTPADGTPPSPRIPRSPIAAGAESRSSLLIERGGGGTSSMSKPCSRAQLRASLPVPSASRISCVAAKILSTAARDAFAASALHRAWIACISATCSGSSFFEASTSSTSLFPASAISVNLLRR